MSNFDLRKFLAEGKLYKENLADTRMEAERDARIFHKDLITKYGFDAVADALEAAYDNAEEGGMGYENIADTLKMDNSILISMIEDTLNEAMSKPTKMKMSELKKKIREEILSELELNEDSTVDLNVSDPNDEYSFVYEATKDGDGEVPSKDADTDIDIVNKEKVEVDVEKKPKATGIDDEFLDQLEDLKDEADAMGDNKLERQIDNTITYFTRQHIAKDTDSPAKLEEADAPINIVTTTDGKTIVGTHQYGVGFKSNETGKKMGFKDNPTSIPNGTKMTKADELEEADDMALVADLEAKLAEGYSEFQRVAKGKKKTAARNKAEEKVYGAGVKKGEEIEKKKLQKESLEILRMKKLAGLLTEGEYAKELLDEADNFTKAHAQIIKTYHNKKDPTSLDNIYDGEDTRNLETYIDKSKYRDRQLFTDLIKLLQNEPNSERTKDAFSSFMRGFTSWMIANKKQLSSRSNNNSNSNSFKMYKSWNDYITSDENRGMF